MPIGRDTLPGIYAEDVFPPPEIGLLTGVPAFLGCAAQGPEDAQGYAVPQRLTLWPQFTQYFGAPQSDGYLADAVRGFFANGGEMCYVLRLQGSDAMVALSHGLARLASLDRIDLVCAPDIMQSYRHGVRPPLATVQQMQQALLAHCEECGDRLAILDALPNATVDEVGDQRNALPGGGSSGANGALYYPWLEVPQSGSTVGQYVPPCGHVAGVYARSDRRVGVHKAPANEVVEEVIDLQTPLTNAQQSALHLQHINCIRTFPGRGIRLWGARTLSVDPAWMYVNIRRLLLTAGRWIERTLADVAFEPNDVLLWARIERELHAYFGTLFRHGALKGATEAEAFYVRCDATTNPPERRAAGMVVTEIGLAPTRPNELVVVRLLHGASGVTLAGLNSA